ncbi:MAG: hypothetical protein ACFFG0_06010 [Candidatus Thorarchaeota archaeon]
MVNPIFKFIKSKIDKDDDTMSYVVNFDFICETFEEAVKLKENIRNYDYE